MKEAGEMFVDKRIVETNQFSNVNYQIFKFNTMEIKILGTGCPKCKTLEKVTREAVSETGIRCYIEKVEDIS